MRFIKHTIISQVVFLCV